MPAFLPLSAPGPPRARLDGIPVEMLVNIGEMTRDGSTRALWALSCTSRQFHAIFNPILYKYDATQMNSLAMFWGAQNGIIGTMSKSLNSGGNVNSFMWQWLHATPLICAISTGRGLVVQWLLANGASPSLADRPPKLEGLHGLYMRSTLRLPFYWAVRQGSSDIVTQLLDAGCQPCQAVSHANNCNTATHVAAAYGHHNLLPLLPPDERNMVDIKGNTPLHTAAQAFHVEDLHYREGPRPSREATSRVLRILISDGADIDARNYDGDTPLYLAFKERQWSAAITLMELGAKPSISVNSLIAEVVRTWPGDIFSTSQRDDRDRAVRLLAEKWKAEKGTGVQSWDSMGPGSSALAYLCSDRDDADSELILFLLELGADPNGKSAANQTPLHILVARSAFNLDNVPSAPLRQPYTPSASPFDLMTKLMRHGASLDQVDSTGRTPLTHLLELLEGETHMPLARFLLWTAWVEGVDPSDETKLPVVQAFGLDVLHKDDPYRARFASMSGKQG